MNYWLLKSEPTSFSITDLAQRPRQCEPWNGVRNYQARNYLKAMQKNDIGFFYHSSCDRPGIVGTVKIVQCAYPDNTAFDPESAYYDPKATIDHPRWFMVDVQLLEIWEPPLYLTQLRLNKALTDLVLLKKGNRLSVMPIATPHAKIIFNLQKNNPERNLT